MIKKINNFALYQDTFIRGGSGKGKSKTVNDITNVFYKNVNHYCRINSNAKNNIKTMIKFLYPEKLDSIDFNTIMTHLFRIDYENYEKYKKRIELQCRNYIDSFNSNKHMIDFNMRFYSESGFYLNSKKKELVLMKYITSNFKNTKDLKLHFTKEEFKFIIGNNKLLIALNYKHILPLGGNTIRESYDYNLNYDYRASYDYLIDNIGRYNFIDINLESKTFNFINKDGININHLGFMENLIESSSACSQLQTIKSGHNNKGLIIFDSKSYDVDNDDEIDSILMKCGGHQVIFVDNLNSNNDKGLTISN